MTDIHPSAPTLKRGRSKYRIRKLLDCWPLLIWVVILGAAILGYSRGIVFERMNGVVDVYQESIAPTEDGVFKGLAPGIKTGVEVLANQEVAYMDTTLIELEISRFEERKRVQLTGDQMREQRRLEDLEDDRDDAARKLEDVNEEIEEWKLRLEQAENDNLQLTVASYRRDLDRLEAQRKRRQERVGNLEDLIKTRKERMAKMAGVEGQEIKFEPEDALQRQLLEERKKRHVLRAKKAGTIDRIGKESGEYVRAGEFVLKVVSEPTHIIGFLPLDEVNALKKHDPVWITSTTDRRTTFESRIKDLSPRIDNARDSASPLPNQRVRGRAVLIDYPAQSGFLPGQTVIIHLKPPGRIPFIGNFFGW